MKGPPSAKPEAAAAELLAYMYDRSLDLVRAAQPAVADEPVARPGLARLGARARSAQAHGQWVIGDRVGPACRRRRPLRGDQLKLDVGLRHGRAGPALRSTVGGGGDGYGFAERDGRGGAVGRAAFRRRREGRRANDEVRGAGPGRALALPLARRRSANKAAALRPRSLTRPPSCRAPTSPRRRSGSRSSSPVADGAATIEFTVPDSVTSWTSGCTRSRRRPARRLDHAAGAVA